MNREVRLVLYPCVELMPTAITRTVRRCDAQAP